MLWSADTLLFKRYADHVGEDCRKQASAEAPRLRHGELRRSEIECPSGRRRTVSPTDGTALGWTVTMWRCSRECQLIRERTMPRSAN